MQDSVLWYSRYAVWVGAIVLLIQSVTGRSVGPITLIGVLLLAAGFLAFVGTLTWQGLAPLQPEGTSASAELPLDLPSSPTPPPAEPVGAPAREEPVEPATRAEPHIAPAAAPLPRIATQVLAPDNPLVGALCAACSRRLETGHTVMRCPQCGSVQHASCWTGNRFSCSVDGCTGKGSLEAPEAG